MKIVTKANFANQWGDVKYGCISKQSMLQLQGTATEKTQTNNDDMNDVNETE